MANSKSKCRHCKEYFDKDLMVKVPLGYFCCYDHATLHAMSKSEESKRKKEAKKTREQKKSLLTASDYIKKAQSAVNGYIRVRDYGKPCISCGGTPDQKIGGTMDAGHYRSRGAAGHLRFNTFNIHGQCVKCNRYNSGNAVDYRIMLIKKIGLDIVERLENDNKPRKFTIEYLERLQKVFLKRARHLKRLRDI